MRAVFLSGPGGVGKTTVGRQLQEMLPDDWLYFEGDRCQPMVPARPAFATAESERRLSRATLEAARAYVTAGFPTLVEIDVVGGERPDICADVFRGVPTVLIVLTARRDVAMRRVLGRGTDEQWLQTYESTYDSVAWANAPTAAIIDTTERAAADVAAEVAGVIRDSA